MPQRITHHIIELFKERLNGTTDVGFRCHCGRKASAQFTDYQAMTSLPSTVPDNICDLVIAAWRAHTKDLDGVHPNAEDQIRDFFSRHLEQPGGPTVTTPRYPLTAIPLGTPKPKSITISALVDEDTRRIIADYAEKLDIAVVPVEGSRFSWTFKASFDGYSDWIVTDRPTGLKSATPTAMREYLERLLGADVQTDVSEELHEVAEELKREDAEASRVDLLKQVAELSETAKKLSRLLGTDWPLELTNTPPSDSQVNLANEIGRLAVEAAARGKSTFRANVTLADPLNFSVFNIRLAEKTPAATTEEQTVNNDRPTRIILRSYAADDKPRIERLLGLARQLQIPVQLAGPWSCTAFPKGEEAHPALDVVFPEVLAHPRDVLILTFPNGEHIGDNGGGSNLSEIENQLLWETREQDQRFVTGLVELLGLHAEASREDIAAAVEARDGDSEIGVITSHQLTECHRQWVRYEECDAQVREILGASQGEEAVEAAKRVTAELAEWKRELASWKADTTALRQETAENQRKLLDILRAGTVEPSWERCISYTEARMKDTISERDALKEQLETAITAERQTIAQRIDLTLTGNAAVTNLDTMLRAVEACREGYTREASNNVNLRRDCEMLQGFIGQIADALDAPPGDRLVVKDDGSLNTALVDRVVGYFKRLYTAAGFTEPPQGGWSEILSNVEDTLAGECPLPSR